jgi:hypothetical protein
MKSIRTLFALGCCLLLSMAGARAATVDLGDMGPPAVEFFGNSFYAPGSYTDDYTFHVGGGSDIFGSVVGLNLPLNKLGIDVLSVALYNGSGMVEQDTSPWAFSFDGLSAGDYILRIVLNVTKGFGLYKAPVGYLGGVAAVEAPVSAVPLPAALPLFASGVGGLGLLFWRRKRAVAAA